MQSKLHQISKNTVYLSKKLNQYSLMISPCSSLITRTPKQKIAFLMLGMSNETNLLLICHCERDEGNTVRVISARKATKNERKHYQRGH